MDSKDVRSEQGAKVTGSSFASFGQTIPEDIPSGDTVAKQPHSLDDIIIDAKLTKARPISAQTNHPP